MDFVSTIRDQTKRALWEVRNVLACVPDALWAKPYCECPLWRHVYHMLHSLDVWFINPKDPAYEEPAIHAPGLNDLDAACVKTLTKEELLRYEGDVEAKILRYLESLTEEAMRNRPAGCPHTRFTLILAQHRHLHTHMGMIMGFIVAETGMWPRVLGLEGEFPQEAYDRFF